MALLPIRLLPDPILRKKGVRVPLEQIKSRGMQQLAEDMIETMRHAKGVGLAAPQVGQSLRLIVIELAATEAGSEGDEPLVLFNPEIMRCIGCRCVEEGCLSVPGYKGRINRCERVVARGWDRRAKEVRIKANELLAQALEHEIDHINGILYLDHLQSHEDLIKLDDDEQAGEGVVDRHVALHGRR